MKKSLMRKIIDDIFSNSNNISSDKVAFEVDMNTQEIFIGKSCNNRICDKKNSSSVEMIECVKAVDIINRLKSKFI